MQKWGSVNPVHVCPCSSGDRAAPLPAVLFVRGITGLPTPDEIRQAISPRHRSIVHRSHQTAPTHVRETGRHALSIWGKTPRVLPQTSPHPVEAASPHLFPPALRLLIDRRCLARRYRPGSNARRPNPSFAAMASVAKPRYRAILPCAVNRLKHTATQRLGAGGQAPYRQAAALVNIRHSGLSHKPSRHRLAP